MPNRAGVMTQKEAAFAGYLAATGDATYAAKMAGYGTPQSRGSEKRHDPAIQEAVRREQAARLTTDLLPLSLNLLERVLLDDKEATRNRITAAQTVLKYSIGLTGDGADAKEPHEMTAAELQARIDALRRIQADRAKPVIDADPAEPGVFD